MEIEVQEDFLSFDADLVAEQLTYMDAVNSGKLEKGKQEGKVTGVTSLSCSVDVVMLM